MLGKAYVAGRIRPLLRVFLATGELAPGSGLSCIVLNRQMVHFRCNMAELTHQGCAVLPRDLQGVPQAKRILIVDDDGKIRNVVRKALESRAFVCEEAVNGSEGVAKAKQLQPDLIILDLAMPVMNGYEAAKILKRDLPEVPVLLFTLYAEQIGTSLGNMLGVKGKISKSDGIGKMVEWVQTLVKS
jgi:CheY-like chemotaxis protein